eukprot:scaffold5342_cov344-Prasinococcus_capsulatus_cf.AAC.4
MRAPPPGAAPRRMHLRDKIRDPPRTRPRQAAAANRALPACSAARTLAMVVDACLPGTGAGRGGCHGTNPRQGQQDTAGQGRGGPPLCRLMACSARAQTPELGAGPASWSRLAWRLRGGGRFCRGCHEPATRPRGLRARGPRS